MDRALQVLLENGDIQESGRRWGQRLSAADVSVAAGNSAEVKVLLEDGTTTNVPREAASLSTTLRHAASRGAFAGGPLPLLHVPCGAVARAFAFCVQCHGSTPSWAT